VIGVATLTLSTTRATEKIGGSLPQNLNFALSTATVVNFLKLKGVDTISASRDTKLEPEELATTAKKSTVQVLCGSAAVSESNDINRFVAPSRGQSARLERIID
jgi:hypothetical protein